MKPRFLRSLATLALSAALLALVPRGDGAFAYGTKSKGLAGGGIALPQDSTAARLNPAGLAFVERRVDGGLAVFNVTPSFTVTGTPSGLPGTSGMMPETVDSEMNNFFIPNLSANWRLGERRTVGFTLYGEGYMGTRYPATAGGGGGIYGTGEAGASVEQVYVLPTYAQRFSETAAWGVSAVLAYQRFKATGLGNMAPFVSDGVPDALTDQGYDTSSGVGFKVGVQADARPNLTVAACYQSSVRMSRFEKYADLFPERGRFNLPPSLQAGLAWHTSLVSAMIFDVEHNWYSVPSALGNPSGNLMQGIATQNPDLLLGGEQGPGFGWRDATIFKLGYQWQSSVESPRWVWRLGARYGRQPISASEVSMNILGPSIQEWRFTTGTTLDLGRRGELNASLMYAPEKAVSGPNPTDLPGQQSVTLNARQVELEVSWGRRF